MTCSLSHPNLKRVAGLSGIMLAIASTASAHTDGASAGGFGSGFHHPWSGLDHIAAMIAVGLWGAQLGAPALWVLPVAFPMVMALGGFLGLVGIPVPGVEIGIGASALLLGLMVAAEIRPKTTLWPALLVGFFGIFHGHAHGTELPPGENGLLFSLGFVTSTGVLHGCGIALGEVRRWSKGATALRAMGVVIALGGAFFLYAANHPEGPSTEPSAAPAK